jgi:acyl-CoA thioesterase I
VTTRAPLRYVALGDSYTIGTSVAEGERWPDQLAERVDALELVANLAVNGSTSADLIADQLPRLDDLRPGFVTVLIGVNDVVQGVPLEQYGENLGRIFDTLLERLPSDRILCLATPDYTRTPQGRAFGDPGRRADEIVRANDVMADECFARGIRFEREPYEVSLGADDDPTLVASDGLHPSGRQYQLWTDAIVTAVEDLLGG